LERINESANERRTTGEKTIRFDRHISPIRCSPLSWCERQLVDFQAMN
jgi:hypothetical protein